MTTPTQLPLAFGRQRKRSYLRSWLVWLSVAGMSSMVFLAVGVVWSQRQAAVKLNKEVRRVAESGQPIDNQSLGRWFRQRTHTEGTLIWGEILSAIHGSFVGYPDFDNLPIQGRGELPEGLVPGGVWPEESIVGEYLEYSRPIIAMIERAAQYPTPVWRPIEFEGIGTLLPELQSSRNIARLLQLEVEHALYHQDTERALRAIRLMGTTVEAFDWDFCIVANIVNHALYGLQLAAIRRSLNADLWNRQQLEELFAILESPQNAEQRFRDTFAAERAMFTSMAVEEIGMYAPTVGGVVHLAYRMPSTRLKLWETYADLQQLADSDLKTMSEAVGRFHRELEVELRRRPFDPGNILTGLLLPAGEAYAGAFIRAEDFRRLTRCALAAKIFQQEYDCWPSRLAELEQVGLPRRERNSVLSGPFGLDKDGEQAVLWTLIVSGPNLQIPTDFSLVNNDDQHLFEVIHIR